MASAVLEGFSIVHQCLDSIGGMGGMAFLPQKLLERRKGRVVFSQRTTEHH